jgi:membrane-bound lytic murein transglycosylase D
MEAQDRFWEHFSAIPPEERIVWTHYTVHKGDTLLKIGRRYHVPVRMIVQMNRLRSPRSLAAGKDLILPIPEGFRSWAEERPFLKRTAIFPTSKPPASAHVVQKGDTLSGIARDHGLSLKALQTANGLGARAAIQPGDQLQIPDHQAD